MTIQSDLEAQGSAETAGSRSACPLSLQTVNDRLNAIVEAKTAGNPFHVRARAAEIPQWSCAS